MNDGWLPGTRYEYPLTVDLFGGACEGLMPVEARLKEDEEKIILMIFEFVIFSFEKVFLIVTKRSER